MFSLCFSVLSSVCSVVKNKTTTAYFLLKKKLNPAITRSEIYSHRKATRIAKTRIIQIKLFSVGVNA